MTVEELESNLSLGGEELADLFGAFRQETGSEDLEEFAVHLRRIGRIDDAELHGLFAETVVELTSPPAYFQRAAETIRLSSAGPLPKDHESRGSGEPHAAAAPSAPPPEVATDHALLGRLGAGAMGEVHLARHQKLRRHVAYKVMTAEAAGSAQLSRRFFAEAQITAQLEHPNIVPLYTLEVRPDGTLAYAMKLVQGQELEGLLTEARALHEEEAPVDETHRLSARLEHFVKICDAMAYAHDKGVVHRDLKPANIMIGRYNELYVMDWGIARVLDHPDSPLDQPVELDGAGEAADAVERTQLGSVLGTPRYMSPEQAQGRIDEIDGRSDIFTLGLILQELVTLQPARTGESLVDMLECAVEGRRERVAHFIEGRRIPRDLVAIIAKATAPNHDDRYATARALADDLRRFLRGEATSVLPDDAIRRLRRWLARNQAKAGVLLGAVLLTAAGVVGTALYEQSKLEVAFLHEQQVTSFLGRVALQADRVDKELSVYEGLLHGLAAATAELLAHAEAGDRPSYVSEDFDNRATRPSDFVASEIYGTGISVDWPVFKLAPSVDRAEVADSMGRLTWLGPRMKTLLLRSRHEDAPRMSDAEARRVVLESTPIHRAFVSRANGVHLSYPGMGGFDESYDGRQQPFYALAADSSGLRWGSPYFDPNGDGIRLPCSTALYDDEGQFVGVAGIELRFDYIIDQLMDIPDLAAVSAAMLVDPGGNVVVSTEHAGAHADLEADHEGERIELNELPFPEVVAAIGRDELGYREVTLETGAEVLVGYFPIDSLGWYYVAVADRPALLDGARPDG